MDLVSDKPYWPIKSGLLHSYPALNHDLKCDVVILGAGITGALCSYHFVKEGLDVVVLDKRDVATGSTSASTAMLQYEIDTPLTELIARMGKTAPSAPIGSVSRAFKKLPTSARKSVRTAASPGNRACMSPPPKRK